MEVYKTTVKDIFDLTNILSENLVIAFKQRPGELDIVTIIKGQVESLGALIEVYSENRFSSPSAEYKLHEVFPILQSMFKKYIDTQKNVNSLLLEIRTIESQIKRGTLYGDHLKEVDDQIQTATTNIMMILQLQTEGLVSSVRGVQSCITYEYTMISTGVDIMKIFKERQRMKCHGKHFTVKFKLMPKDILLDTNNIKEEKPNGSDKGKQT